MHPIKVFILAQLCFADPDPQLSAIVDAHTAAVRSVHTLTAHFEFATPGSAGKSAPSTEYWWTKEGDRERCRVVAHGRGVDVEGRPLGISEWVLDQNEYRWLQNWDPARPQKITPLYQGTVRAEIGPQTDENPGALNPAFGLMLEVSDTPRRSVAELVATARHASLKGKAKVDGHETYLITAECAERSGKITTTRFYDVYLDAAVNYMIRTLAVRIPKEVLPDGRSVEYSTVTRARAFQEFGTGVYLPSAVETEVFRTGAPNLDERGEVTSVMRLHSLRVNKPLPSDAFDLNFPKYAAVRHLPPVNGKVRVDIWGDGSPLTTAESFDEVRAFEDELRRDPATRAEFDDETSAGSQVLSWAIYVVPAILAFLVVALLIRRARMRG